MQKINLIAQSVLELSHREKSDDEDEDEDEDDDDTHPDWIIVRDGMYSVADKKRRNETRNGKRWKETDADRQKGMVGEIGAACWSQISLTHLLNEKHPHPLLMQVELWCACGLLNNRSLQRQKRRMRERIHPVFFESPVGWEDAKFQFGNTKHSYSESIT